MSGLWLSLALALVSVMPGSPTQSGATELKGKCEANSTLAGMMKQRDGVERVTAVECDRVVIDAGKRASFYKGKTLVAVFEGHAGDATDITMDRVTVGSAAPAATTNGRCRIYKNDNLGELMLLCFAAYSDGGQKRGAIATFSTRVR